MFPFKHKPASYFYFYWISLFFFLFYSIRPTIKYHNQIVHMTWNSIQKWSRISEESTLPVKYQMTMAKPSFRITAAGLTRQKKITWITMPYGGVPCANGLYYGLSNLYLLRSSRLVSDYRHIIVQEAIRIWYLAQCRFLYTRSSHSGI